MYLSSPFILVIEPNEKLTHPYIYLDPSYHNTRISSLTEAKEFTKSVIPNLIILSASFEIDHTVDFLSDLSSKRLNILPGLVFMVDLSNQLSYIPGTTWGNKCQVLSNLCSPKIFIEIVDELVAY
jgi:hypothetical protein